DQKIVFVGVDKLNDPAFAKRMKAFANAATPGFDDLASLRAINTALLDDALLREEDASRYANIIPNIETIMQLPGAGFESYFALWGLFHGSKQPVNGREPLAMRLNKIEGLQREGRDGDERLPSGLFQYDASRGSASVPRAQWRGLYAAADANGQSLHAADARRGRNPQSDG
ncbi:MAG: hypothetical protein HRU11_15720, partial [Parvularculaceae bacterium]|nr:hypothetical protein [Parvularculaceae bacterium]